MEYIRVTKENLEKEHICCAISNNKDIQVSSKKAWLADRFDEGLVFLWLKYTTPFAFFGTITDTSTSRVVLGSAANSSKSIIPAL